MAIICLWNFRWNSPLKNSPQFLRFSLLGSEGWGTWPEICWSEKVVENQLWRGSKFRAGSSRWNNDHASSFLIPILWLTFISYYLQNPHKKNHQQRRQQGCLGFCVVEPLDGLEVHLRKNSNGVERWTQQVDSSYHGTLWGKSPKSAAKRTMADKDICLNQTNRMHQSGSPLKSWFHFFLK